MQAGHLQVSCILNADADKKVLWNNLLNAFVNLQRFIYLRPAKAEMFWRINAGVAQLVERHLAKVEVAGSSLVSRSDSKKAVLTPWKMGLRSEVLILRAILYRP